MRLLPNLQANSRQAALEKIISLINEFSVEAIVIGRPDPQTTGSIAIARRADGLKETLDQIISSLGLPITIYLCDETLTSRRAMATLVEAHVPQKKRRQMLDAASAAILVEDFLASRPRKMGGT